MNYFIYLALVLIGTSLTNALPTNDEEFEVREDESTTQFPYPTYTLPPPTSPTPPPPPPPPPCPTYCLMTGVYDFPHFNACSRFYRCLHGFFFDMACSEGQAFDYSTLRCLPSDEAECILNHQFQ